MFMNTDNIKILQKLKLSSLCSNPEVNFQITDLR